MNPNIGQCANCYESFYIDNGCMTEDGHFFTCSEECLQQLEQDLEYGRQAEREQNAYYEASRGVSNR